MLKGNDAQRRSFLRILFGHLRVLSAAKLRLSRLSQLRRNALFALGQAIVSAGTLFLAYRFTINHLGLELLGVWSLMMSVTSFVRVADISGAGALTRFLAIRTREGRATGPRDTVHTILITSTVFNTSVALVIWAVAPIALPYLFTNEHLTDANRLLPLVVLTFVTGTLAAAIAAAVDGIQRADIRALILMAASLGFLFLTHALIPIFGILGFAIAQLLQGCLVITVGWIVLRRQIGGLGWLPFRWNTKVFKETTTYSLKLNIISILALLFDPVAKIGFNHIGGPSQVAIYDIASRLVTQMRGLVIAAAMPLVPAIAAQAGPATPELLATLKRTTKLAALAALAVSATGLVAAPIVSALVLGEISNEFLVTHQALTIGWSANLLGLGFYLAAQAHGVLIWNILGHAVTAAIVLTGALVLAPAFAPAEFAFAIAFGLALSTVPILVGNARALNAEGTLRDVTPRILLTCAALLFPPFLFWLIT